VRKRMQDTNLLYMDGLYSYAMVLARNPATAADLVQETYVRALNAKDKLRENSNIKSWLYTILRNIWLNQLRYQRSRPEVSDMNSENLLHGIASDEGKDPYAQYVRKVEREQVREAIQQLPDEFREIIVLREYEELSYQEIGSILNFPPGTVMSRLARARSRLRDLLAARWQPASNRAGSPRYREDEPA
jgi:RNA polymerase sigma-70 factor, ECF subfamily